MPFRVEAVVTEIKADFDPYGGEYVWVAFGYRIPVPLPPSSNRPGQPKPIFYKHVAHVIIPKDQWVGQYTMWETYEVEIKDDGTVTIRRPGAKQ